MKNKENSNKLIVLIGILGAIFMVLLILIVANLITGHAHEPYEVKSMAYSLAKGSYSDLMQDIYRDKSRKLTKIKSDEYYKYQGAGEYFRYAVMYYALEGEDEVQEELCAGIMAEGKEKMKDIAFTADDMDAKIKKALEKAALVAADMNSADHDIENDIEDGE